MFTRLAKGILVLSAIAVLILAVLVSISTESGLAFLVVLILGGIFLFSFGIFVELANNVMDIKEFLAKENSVVMKPLGKKVNSTEDVSSEEWVCSKCGTSNPSDTTWCAFCGRQTK